MSKINSSHSNNSDIDWDSGIDDDDEEEEGAG